MITGDFALLLNLASIASLGFILGYLLICVLCLTCNRLFDKTSVTSRKVLLWLVATAPWLVGFTTMLMFVPALTHDIRAGLDDAEHWHYPDVLQVAHWHHPDVFNPSSWHGILLFTTLMYLVILAAKKCVVVHRAGSSLCTLNAFSKAEKIDGVAFRVIDSRAPNAFTAGVLKPQCYISTALVNALDKTELAIIAAHEQAHIDHKDPLFKPLFSFLCDCFPKPVGRFLQSRYVLVTELLADKSTVKRYDAPDIAATLVKVARMQKAIPGMSGSAQFSHFGGDHLSQRVRHLVAADVEHHAVGSLLVVATALLLILPFSAVDQLHHLIEFIFSH